LRPRLYIRSGDAAQILISAGNMPDYGRTIREAKITAE
jgi:hypothetical protein